MKSMDQLKYSILDLAVISEGEGPKEAIQRSRETAIKAEEMGYHRFWMAEHHNMENIASSATSVLLGHMAEATKRIHIGSGGIMLPNHSPLMIAEQMGTLATMYPGRIDLGLGRAPGTDQTTANAIRPDRMQAVHAFPKNVKQLQLYLSEKNKSNKVRAIPGEGTNIPIYILGSSTDSAHLAAALGLPYVFASHFAPQQLMPALQIYHQNFEPSEQLDEPYTIVCANIIAADSDEKAEYLSTSLKQMFMGIVTGERKPMQPPVEDMGEVWSMYEQSAVSQMLRYSFVGGKDKIRSHVQDFMGQTHADEIMVASYIYDQKERIQSYRIFADIMKNITAGAEV